MRRAGGGHLIPAMNPQILTSLLQTKEFKAFAAETAPALLDLWAGGRAMRGIVSRAASGCIKRGLSTGKAPSVSDLFSDPQFARDLLTEAAPLIRGLMRRAAEVLSALSKLPPQALAEVASGFMESSGPEDIGCLLTDAVRLLNRLHETDGTFLSEKLRPALRGLIIKTDFGEIREALDRSREDLSAVLSAVLDELFAYPGKVLILFSFLPDVVAAGVSIMRGCLSRLNEMPPDLLCDIAVSYGEKVDPSNISGLINQAFELIRKLHTGSGLLGEVGIPRIPSLFSQFLERLYRGIDRVALLKAASAGNDFQRAWHEAMTLAQSRNPGMRAATAASKAQAFASRMRLLSGAFAADDDLGPDEQEAFSDAVLGAIHLRDAAEAVNGAVRRMLLFWERRPELCRKVVIEGIEAIDESALLRLAERILDETGPCLAEKLAPVVERIGDRLSRGRDRGGTGCSGTKDGREVA